MVAAICNESYHAKETDPLEYGIGRAKFEELKLRRLILLAEQAGLSKMAQQKAADWRQQLQRVHRIRTKLEERRIASRILTTPRNQSQPTISFPPRACEPLERWRPSGPG